ncbi:MAG TPA: hypothetical protein VFF16_03510 [Telluria sp.]|nr:hypothetical protein [Telluria sp.]
MTFTNPYRQVARTCGCRVCAGSTCPCGCPAPAVTYACSCGPHCGCPNACPCNGAPQQVAA